MPTSTRPPDWRCRAYKNSGQRCTAVKRMLVHRGGRARFTDALVAKTRAWTFGDPDGPQGGHGHGDRRTRRRLFEARVAEAVAQGARLLVGNRRDGALFSPTVIDRVARDDGGARGDLRPGVADHHLQHR